MTYLNKHQSILIIQTAFIGDVVLATSFIEEVKKKYPLHKIDFLLRKGNESILQFNPHISHIYLWDKKKYKIFNLIKIIKIIRSKDYHIVFNLQRYFSSGFVTIFSKAKIKIGFLNNPLSFFFTKKILHKIIYQYKSQYLHEVQRNFLLLNSLQDSDSPIPDAKLLTPKLYFGTNEIERSLNSKLDKLGCYNSLSPYIVIAPTSVWFTKQYSITQWIQFLVSMSSHSSNFSSNNIFLVGGKDDYNTLDFIINESKHIKSYNLAGKLDLLETAFLMKNAKRVFVNDSAPLHLASAVNAPTTAIFCSTIPDFGFYPLSSNNIILEISREKLPCRPCGIHGKKSCPESHYNCSKFITTNQLIDSLH